MNLKNDPNKNVPPNDLHNTGIIDTLYWFLSFVGDNSIILASGLFLTKDTFLLTFNL